MGPIAEEFDNDIFDRYTEKAMGIVLPPIAEGIGAEGFWYNRSKAEFLAPLLELPFGVLTLLFGRIGFTSAV